MSASMKFNKLNKLYFSCINLPFRSSKRYSSSKIYNLNKLSTKLIGEEVYKVQGWVKGKRKLKEKTFLDLQDGLSHHKLQIVVDSAKCGSEVTFGSAIEVEGRLVKSNHPKQDVELLTESLKVVGSCDEFKFPLKAKQNHDADYLRKFLHLRSKSKFFGSILRIRSETTQAIHRFFEDDDYVHIHTPLLTANDCEGAGETFIVNAQYRDEQNPEEVIKFFEKPVNLSVSGQLHLEAITSGISKAYCFNPAFRAEKSITRRHLAEFYMVEAELAFVDNLDEILGFVERLVKGVTERVIERCRDDLKTVSSEDHIALLQALLSRPFARMTYSEAIDILKRNENKLSKPVSDDGDLIREQELLLVNLNEDIPVFVTDYPANSKPFYMKRDGGVVKSVDLLAPFVGELCGGSIREDSLSLLEKAIIEMNQVDALDWYVDLRKFGNAPHGGFGLGFERLLMLLTGLKNIKDVVPFPRWYHDCTL